MHDPHDFKHVENESSYKGISVKKGVEHHTPINLAAAERFLKNRKKKLSVNDYVEGILKGNITVLSQAVTLIESSLPQDQKLAREIIVKCLPHSGNSVRIGITGVPGAGKSTFIEAMGIHLINQGSKLAVLAIDPSSERTKGSILGDKTRMEELSSMANAYIRPSPSAGSLGGVARKTRETIILCEAAGYDTIFIETVGVGQSETAVHSMVDFFLLILIGGAGDELQGIKRGIMEMADGIAVNKADGENIQKAELARSQYRNALHLFPPSISGWVPKVETCSSLESKGVVSVWQMISDYISHTKTNNYFSKKRKVQAQYWMYETINESLRNNFYQNSLIQEKIATFEAMVNNDQISSFEAARILLNTYYNNK